MKCICILSEKFKDYAHTMIAFLQAAVFCFAGICSLNVDIGADESMCCEDDIKENLQNRYLGRIIINSGGMCREAKEKLQGRISAVNSITFWGM